MYECDAIANCQQLIRANAMRMRIPICTTSPAFNADMETIRDFSSGENPLLFFIVAVCQ